MTRFWIGGVACLACTFTAAPAFSRAVVIDSNSDIQYTPCTYGTSSCQPFSTVDATGSRNSPPATGTGPIDFTLNYGAGPQSAVYVYNNGLISIGSPLSGTGNPFSTPGVNVLSPAYNPSSQVLADSFTYSTGNDGSGFFGSQTPEFFRLNYMVRSNNDPSTDTAVQATFFQNGDPGDFTLFFAYGTFSKEATLLDDTIIGFKLGANQVLTTAGQNQSAIANTDDTTTFRYDFVGGQLVGGPPVGAVPEPSTWALMIFGFGIIGGVMRRRRHRIEQQFA